MRVLLWHVHGSWTTAFVQGGHEYLIPVADGPDGRRSPDGLGRARTWDWPAGAREVTPAQVREEQPDVVVLQRTRDLAILKAIGASNSYLLKDALGQAAVILGIGALIGGVAAFGLGLLMQGGAPFSLTALTAIAPPVAIWALGMVGALIATRSIVKVNPQQALGGAA